jgi:hypothetical protein
LRSFAALSCALLLPWSAHSQSKGLPERVFATEDSLRVYTAPETTRVVGKRVPLEEIIRKAQEGERRKYDGIKTLAYDRIIKITMAYGDSLGKKRCIENVTRVYYRADTDWAEVPLRKSKYIIDESGARKPWKEKEDKEEVDIEVSEGEGEEGARQLSELPVYLEDTEKFRFRILNRSLRPDQVLYEIGFEPKSEFDVLPGGRLWLLTNGYQIVREEYHMKNLPFPWILKSVALVTRDWQQVQGRWLPRRITARATLREHLGLGLVEVPRAIEFVVFYDDYRLDPELDPALFERRTR